METKVGTVHKGIQGVTPDLQYHFIGRIKKLLVVDNPDTSAVCTWSKIFF